MMHFSGHGAYEVAVEQEYDLEYRPARIHVKFNLQDGKQLELFGDLHPGMGKLLPRDHPCPRDLLKLASFMQEQGEYEAALTSRVMDLEKENSLLREQLSRAGKEADIPLIMENK